MQRRDFLAGTLATTAVAFGQTGVTPPAPHTAREYYQLRSYRLQNGPQLHLVESYFSEVLIPSLTRLGLGPIGAFRLEFGPEIPMFYLLIPGTSLELLATIDLQLAKDTVFLTAAAPFWNAPATSPAFVRVDSSLLVAFEGWPRIVPPPAAAAKQKRILQLRTYESPSYHDHVRKVEMFHSGEFQIFEGAGFHPVFFGDGLIGARMPSLTYMLSFADMSELTAQWAAFSADPTWMKLRTSPHFAYEEIVSNITNLVLSPLAASQI